MAKAATKEKPDTKKSDIDKVKPSLYLPVTYITEMPRVAIPWSPGFQEALGGSIISGSMTTLAGPPKSAKTSSLLQLAKNCQDPKYGGQFWGVEEAQKRGFAPGRPVFYLNVEGRLTKRDIMSVAGMNYDPDKFMIVSSTYGNKLYLEDYFAHIEQIIDLYPGCVLILDSVGALCSKKVAMATDGDQVRDTAPILTSFFMKRIAADIQSHDIIFLSVLHQVSNTGAKPGQSTKTTTGGIKQQYAAFNRLEIKWTEMSKDDDECLILHLFGRSSELGKPETESTACLRLGKGLWDSYELLNLCITPECNGLFGVHKAGAWYTIGPEVTGDKPIKLQGIINASNWFDENKKAYQKLYHAYSKANWKNQNLYIKK